MIQDDKKQCGCCQELLDLEHFSKSSRNKDGFFYECKKCHNLKRKQYRDNNSEILKLRRKEYYKNNLTKMREEKLKYTQSRRQEKRDYDFNYRKDNAGKIKKYKKTWETKKRHDPIFKIKRNLRRRVHHVLKSGTKSDKTFNLIGCSPEEFKKHIESLWQLGMSWDNYGPKGWHIDHIVPCYKFDLSLEEEQRKCFHYLNQRPLWSWENLSRRRD